MAFENLRKKGKAFLEFVKGEKDKDREKDKEKEDPIVDKTVKIFKWKISRYRKSIRNI